MKAPKAAPKPPHRPPYEPTDKERISVEVMIAGGIEHVAIAKAVGIAPRTLRKHFRKEIDNAATQANAAVVAALDQMATKGKNVVAAIWWTKTRMRWSEKIVVEGEGDFGYAKLIEVLEARRQKPNGGDPAT